MDYPETKVYFDGSHYIAIPHTEKKKKNYTNKRMEEWQKSAIDVKSGCELMAEETERYVFRILAIKAIFENPEKYGIYVSSKLSYEPYRYNIVKVDKSVENWAEFAKEHDITYKLLKVFNPWLRSNSLKVNKGEVYEIKIPKKPFNITHSHIMNLIGNDYFLLNDSLALEETYYENELN